MEKGMSGWHSFFYGENERMTECVMIVEYDIGQEKGNKKMYEMHNKMVQK